MADEENNTLPPLNPDGSIAGIPPLDAKQQQFFDSAPIESLAREDVIIPEEKTLSRISDEGVSKAASRTQGKWTAKIALEEVTPGKNGMGI